MFTWLLPWLAVVAAESLTESLPQLIWITRLNRAYPPEPIATTLESAKSGLAEVDISPEMKHRSVALFDGVMNILSLRMSEITLLKELRNSLSSLRPGKQRSKLVHSLLDSERQLILAEQDFIKKYIAEIAKTGQVVGLKQIAKRYTDFAKMLLKLVSRLQIVPSALNLNKLENALDEFSSMVAELWCNMAILQWRIIQDKELQGKEMSPKDMSDRFHAIRKLLIPRIGMQWAAVSAASRIYQAGVQGYAKSQFSRLIAIYNAQSLVAYFYFRGFAIIANSLQDELGSQRTTNIQSLHDILKVHCLTGRFSLTTRDNCLDGRLVVDLEREEQENLTDFIQRLLASLKTGRINL